MWRVAGKVMSGLAYAYPSMTKEIRGSVTATPSYCLINWHERAKQRVPQPPSSER